MSDHKNAFTLALMLLLASPATTQSATAGTATASSDVLQRSCNSGNGTSCLTLAQRYETGRGVRRDADKAALYNAAACKAGTLQGCQILKSVSEQGRGIRQDYMFIAYNGIRCSQGEQAACRGNSEISIEAGPSLQAAQWSRVSQATTAVARPLTAAFIEKCDLGDAAACFFAGMEALQRGNPGRGIPLYQKACSGGYDSACGALGLFHRDGDHGLTRDHSKYVSYTEMACNFGSAIHCGYLAEIRRLSAARAQSAQAAAQPARAATPAPRSPQPALAAAQSRPSNNMSAEARYLQTIRCLTLSEVKRRADEEGADAPINDIQAKLSYDLNIYRNILRKSEEETLGDIKMFSDVNFANLFVRYKTTSGRVAINSELADCNR
jgi:TPR repeat protein